MGECVGKRLADEFDVPACPRAASALTSSAVDVLTDTGVVGSALSRLSRKSSSQVRAGAEGIAGSADKFLFFLLPKSSVLKKSTVSMAHAERLNRRSK